MEAVERAVASLEDTPIRIRVGAPARTGIVAKPTGRVGRRYPVPSLVPGLVASSDNAVSTAPECHPDVVGLRPGMRPIALGARRQRLNRLDAEVVAAVGAPVRAAADLTS